MLESLEIKGFRGVNAGGLEGLGRVNVLIGPNGCGKTTILEALLVLASSIGSTDVLGVNFLDIVGGHRNEGRLPPACWFATSFPAQIAIAATMREVTLRSVVQRDSWTVRTEPRGEVVRGPSDEIQEARRFLTNLLFLDATRALSARVEHVLWDRAFQSGAHREIMRLFEAIYGRRIETLTYTADQRILLDLPPRPLPLDSLGAGMRIAFRVLLAALVARGSAVLLEEFDAYQNKAALAKLADGLTEVAVRNDVQLFLTTHSLETVNAFLNAAEARKGGIFKVFPLELALDGTLRAHGLAEEGARKLLDAGLDLRDLDTYAK